MYVGSYRSNNADPPVIATINLVNVGRRRLRRAVGKLEPARGALNSPRNRHWAGKRFCATNALRAAQVYDSRQARTASAERGRGYVSVCIDGKLLDSAVLAGEYQAI